MPRILIVLLLAIFVLPLDAAAAFPEDFDRMRDAQVAEEETQEQEQEQEDVHFFRNTPPPFPGNMHLPYEQVSRAEFVVQIVHRLYPEGMPECFLTLSPSRYSLLFADVAKDAAYGEELCIAMYTGLIRGYPDATFRPDAPINFAEASKVLTKAYGLSTDLQAQSRGTWFQPYVAVMRYFGILPAVHDLSLPVTRADLASMLSKLE